jgi:hypothetical protein
MKETDHYAKGNLATTRSGGVWSSVPRPRGRAQTFLRCLHCQRINDVTRIHPHTVYESGQVSGHIFDCWSCRGCRHTLTGVILSNWSIQHIGYTPFGPHLARLEESLKARSIDARYRVEGPLRSRDYNTYGWRWNLQISRHPLNGQHSNLLASTYLNISSNGVGEPFLVTESSSNGVGEPFLVTEGGNPARFDGSFDDVMARLTEFCEAKKKEVAV